jgi:hypothetical protein
LHAVVFAVCHPVECFLRERTVCEVGNMERRIVYAFLYFHHFSVLYFNSVFCLQQLAFVWSQFCFLYFFLYIRVLCHAIYGPYVVVGFMVVCTEGVEMFVITAINNLEIQKKKIEEQSSRTCNTYIMEDNSTCQ